MYSILTKSLYKVTMNTFMIRGPLLTLSRRGLQICNTKFNYLQLIRFSFKITSKQFLYLRGPMLPLVMIYCFLAKCTTLVQTG